MSVQTLIKIEWPDGTFTIGTSDAESPDLFTIIEWTGVPERLQQIPPDLREENFPVVLYSRALRWAARVKAKATTTETGKYSTWAE